MTQSELLAMIDITADHGTPAPTLDDWAVAIEALRQRDAQELAYGQQIAQMVESQTNRGMQGYGATVGSYNTFIGRMAGRVR